MIRRLQPLLLRGLNRADGLCNRLYTWRYNPLYQSGAIAVGMLAVLILTGIWLLVFYRIGSPWASVNTITQSAWTGNWVRGVHRYASDVALVAAVVHLLRVFAQGRTWGPRALAWISGLLLLGVLLVSGWTGFVMVWDTFGYQLALEGARLFDALPVLSEPIGRLFTGDRAVPNAFFFLNLFLHVALPLGMGLILWVHVSRIARPTLLPPRGLLWGLVGLLTLLAVVWPLAMAPQADPFAMPPSTPADWWYGFWLPLTQPFKSWFVWAVLGLLATLAAAVPWLSRPRGEASSPSSVDQQLCTECRQCAVDCPYEAISMVPRDDGRPMQVARVDPSLCVSCGICAGSCAPMGVGPAGRTGRNQLDATRAFLKEMSGKPSRVVVLGCRHGAGAFADRIRAEGAEFRPLECAGNLHSSVVEFLIRGGAAGVLVLSCPPRDCRGREGPRWMLERLFSGREAELKSRVDRRFLRVEYAGAGEWGVVLEAVRRFQEDMRAVGTPPAESDLDLDLICEPVELEEETV